MTTHHRKIKSNTGTCFYHLCRKRAEVHKCELCGEFFCDEHLRPKPPSMPNFKSTSHRDALLMEEYHKPDGHPCIPFWEHWNAENERKGREYGQALNRLIKSKPIHFEDERPKHQHARKEPSKKSFASGKKHYVKYVIGGLIIFFSAYLILNSGPERLLMVVLKCTDGTSYNLCSDNQPYFCLGGKLVENASACGCPYDYSINGQECKKIQRCNDSTIYGECSLQKPLYCLNGSLVKRVSLCGCPADEISFWDNCISKYEAGPKQEVFNYTIRWQPDSIKLTVYAGLNDYLAGLPRSYYCDPSCPSDTELELRFIEQNEQKKYLEDLAEAVRSKTNISDEQARIAISLVQSIPFDNDVVKKIVMNLYSSNYSTLNERYPYEVLYDNTGVCGEKSRLLAFILRDLGYGVVLFRYETERHMTVGIKCPLNYSYENTGYCFIETTTPNIVTYSEGNYPNLINCTKSDCSQKLSHPSEIINVSDGKSFDSISEEFNDAQAWNELYSDDNYLIEGLYNKWYTLASKYGIEVT